MQFKTNFPWSFHIRRYSNELKKKSNFERMIIKNQYSECCNNISDEIINYYLETCNQGVIVVGGDGKLKGFTLSNFNESDRIFTTAIIAGDEDALRMIIQCVRLSVKDKASQKWILYVELTMVNIIEEFGFNRVIDDDSTNIKMQKIY